MDLIGPELSELFALEFAKLLNLTLLSPYSYTNVDQLVLNMVTVYMTVRSWMSLIMGQIQT